MASPHTRLPLAYFPPSHPSSLPVSVNEAGVDVVGSLQASDWLQADARGLVGHDVDQPILELVARKVGTDEARRVGFGVGQTLEGKDEGRDGGTEGKRNAQKEGAEEDEKADGGKEGKSTVLRE